MSTGASRQPSDGIKPFKIQVSDADLEDLKLRLNQTRWANELPNSGDDYGLTVQYVR
jgi:Epoxide hydrolase N terminus.